MPTGIVRGNWDTVTSPRSSHEVAQPASLQQHDRREGASLLLLTGVFTIKREAVVRKCLSDDAGVEIQIYLLPIQLLPQVFFPNEAPLYARSNHQH